MDLNAQNVRATVRIFGVETDMVWIQPECSYMVNISVVLKNPSDATKHEELAKYLADTFGVCVGLKLQCCYTMSISDHDNKKNLAFLKSELEEREKEKTFFYKSKLNPKLMCRVADFLQAIQNECCVGNFCKKYEERKICKDYDNGFCLSTPELENWKNDSKKNEKTSQSET